MGSEARQDAFHTALAIAAAKQAGLDPPTAGGAAADEEVRAIRDGLWREGQRRLADAKTYTLEEVLAWMEEVGGPKVGRSSIHRSRQAVLAREQSITQTAELARRTVEAVGDTGESDVARAGRALAMQLLFDTFRGLRAEDLSGLSPSQILQMCNVVGQLGKMDVESKLKAALLAEVQRRFDDQVRQRKAARGKADGGGITEEDLAAIRQTVFGGST